MNITIHLIYNEYGSEREYYKVSHLNLAMLQTRSPNSWTDGPLGNLTFIRKTNDVARYTAVLNDTKYRGLRYFEKLWLVNMKINGKNLPCAANVLSPTLDKRCHDPNVSGGSYIYQIRVTGPVRNDFCEQVIKNKTHLIDSCCLEERGSYAPFGERIGKYRILANRQVMYGTWQFMRSIIRAINEKNKSCLYNIYWLQ
ncbi:hypothetical protein EG68_12129 [Paragonimus skrjabini miyazakii]|uniref:Uncharacterized protein n=1 Tax=Paragonimus skrjabini miyazakii TaxID=59628 RepID=A0A8S9YD97_9TREM|nr:hypothetical protein EG68_12017 [Paragonimus skrjabini miyazakii]KAF7234311.1 hypothetical protein EG68_12129 [Paragonimus skrjabini miyazakii]